MCFLLTVQRNGMLVYHFPQNSYRVFSIVPMGVVVVVL